MNTKVIIGIHGLNNKPEPDMLRKWWKAAITEGVSRNCRVQRADFDFVLAYWADVLYSAPVAPTEQKEPYVVAEGNGSLPRAGSSIRRIAAALIREGVGKVL